VAETTRVSIPTDKQITDYNGSAKSLYSSLETQRFTFLRRARDAAELTIPTLMPPQGHNYSTIYPTPYQSIGARGVNNLASKLMLALLPPNAPFFRLAVEETQLMKDLPPNTSAADITNLKTEMEKALSKVERIASRDIEGSSIRVGTYEALRQLIVAGNVLLYFPDDGGMRVFRLDTYGVKRDKTGNVVKIAVKESIAPAALPPEVKAFVDDMENAPVEGEQKQNESNENNLELYTCVMLAEDGKKWEVYQEICGEIIPSTRGTYPLDKLPWMALRLVRIDGEDYGRGFVEEYMGDLKALEALSQGVIQATAAASKVVFMVDPTGTTKIKDLASSPNGAFISGKSTDVTALQVEKRADLSVVNQVIADITQRLSFAFLLNTAIQRNGERVTAEEIRYMAQELESSLGGAYSILSQEFQLPLVTILLDRLAKQKRLPDMPKKLVKPLIVTGVEALGRGNDLNKLDQFISGIAQALGPQALQLINQTEYLNRRAAALGIDAEGLIRSQEEIQQEQQQSQMMDMANKLGPAGIQAASKVATATPEAANSTYEKFSGQPLPQGVSQDSVQKQ
jgi:Bacteriophage head to tail connecting protein